MSVGVRVRASVSLCVSVSVCECVMGLVMFKCQCKCVYAYTRSLQQSPVGDCAGTRGPITRWDVSKITNMSALFKNAASFNQVRGQLSSPSPPQTNTNTQTHKHTRHHHRTRRHTRFNQRGGQLSPSPLTHIPHACTHTHTHTHTCRHCLRMRKGLTR